jgi:hypothetical protein
MVTHYDVDREGAELAVRAITEVVSADVKAKAV